MTQTRIKFEPVTANAFHMILLEAAADTLPHQIRGSIGGIEPVTFTWNGRAFRQLLPAFRAFEARRLNGGAPQRTLSGLGVAVADPGARLIKVTFTEDGVSTVAHGVITIPSVSVGPGGSGVASTSIIFHRADALYFYGSTDSEVAP